MTKEGSSNEKLQESEEKYKRLIESLPHGLSIIQHNEIVFANKSALEMFGYEDSDEFLGKEAMTPLFKPERDRIFEKCLKLLNDELNGPLNYKAKAVKKDGTIFQVEAYVSKIIYQGWRALQVVMIDRTEKVELEQNFQRFLDSIADPLHVLNKDLEYVYANEPLKDWVKALGYSDEVIGKRIQDVFPFLPEEMIEGYEKVFFSGETLITHDSTEVKGKNLYTETRKIPIIENNKVSQVLTIVRDVTERKLYEEKIKESEEKYRHLFENSPYFIMLLDESLNIVDYNRTTEHIVGYNRDDLIGKNIFKIFSGLKKIELLLKKSAEKVLKGKPLSANELQIRRKDGGLIWIDPQASLMTIRGKKYIHLIGQDITEPKEQEKKLKLNQFAIDNTSIEVFWINAKGEIIYANKAACNKLGYTYEELTNLKVPDVDPTHNFEKFKKFYDRTKENESITFETKHQSKEGSSYPVRVTSVFLNYEGDELNIAFGIDLSEQKIAKEKLKSSEEKYRSLFTNAPYSNFLINMEGKILDCNQATVDLFGFSKDEMISKSHRELDIHPEGNLNNFIKRFVKLIKGKPVEPIETQLFTKDKILIWVHIRSALIKIGEEYYIQTIIQDIEERKRAEKELKKLNRMKSDLLKRTSHELKTPLVSIKGFANLLTEINMQDFNSKTLSYIGEIKNGCRSKNQKSIYLL